MKLALTSGAAESSRCPPECRWASSIQSKARIEHSWLSHKEDREGSLADSLQASPATSAFSGSTADRLQTQTATWILLGL